MPANPDATHVRKLKEVGRYALGVEWGDGHDSILPYKTIRHVCPCDVCSTPAEPPPGSDQPTNIEVLGDRSVFFRWSDAHETLLLLEELRALCRCARCVGEPDYPISGR
jgi:DUF971 family protein